MHIALYVGQNPQRTALLAFAAPIVAACAHRVTLITPVSGQNDLDEVVNQLHIDTAIPVQHRCQETTFAAAILSAVQTERPDLLIAPAFPPHFIRGRRLEFNLLAALPVSFLRVQGHVSASPIRRIAVASAGGEQSLRCVPLVSQIARAFQASVTVLHVSSQEVVYFDGFVASPLTEEVALQLDELTGTMLRRLVKELNTQGVDCHLQVLNGLVEETLLNESQHYDLLVIGSHEVSGVVPEPGGRWVRMLQRLSLQDVTRDLLERSPIPVLVIR